MRGCYWYVLFVSSFTYFAPRNGAHTFFHVDAQNFSPELIKEEANEDEEEAGSFSPELLHGDENEEAIDPEEDRAMLVS